MAFFNNASAGELNDTFSVSTDDSAGVADVRENHFTDKKSLFYSMNSLEIYDRTISFPNDTVIASVSTDLVLIAFYVTTSLLSLALNTVIVNAVLKYRDLRSVTNLLTAKLAMMDISVALLCMPIQLKKSITLEMFYEKVAWKFAYYLQAVSITTSALTMAAMVVNRYLAIKYFFSIPILPKKTPAVLAVSLLWALQAVAFVPLRIVAIGEQPVSTMSIVENILPTAEDWTMSLNARRFFGILNFFLIYVIPGVIVVLAFSLMRQRLYSAYPVLDVNNAMTIRFIKERKRVGGMLLLLAVLYVFFWLPYNCIQLLVDTECISHISVKWLLPYALLLGYSNPIINSIAYCFMTQSFRKYFKKFLTRVPESHQESPRSHQRRGTPRAVRGPMVTTDYCNSPHYESYIQMHGLRRNDRSIINSRVTRYLLPNPGQEMSSAARRSPLQLDFQNI